MDTFSPVHSYKLSDKTVSHAPQTTKSSTTLPPIPKPPSILPPIPKPPIHSLPQSPLANLQIPKPPILPPIPRPPQVQPMVTLPPPPTPPTSINQSPSPTIQEDLPPSQKILAESGKTITKTTSSPSGEKIEQKLLSSEHQESEKLATTSLKPDLSIRSIEDYSSKVVKTVDEKDRTKGEKDAKTGIIIQTAKEPDHYQQLIKQAEDNGTPPDLLERMEQIIKRVRAIEKSSSNFDIIAIEQRYLEWLALLPWNKETEDLHDLQRAQKILDQTHFGMQNVKARILEFLAVQQLTNNAATAPVLCFLGTPGVGKTTLSRTIAAALGRKFIRVSLAAMGDVHQIKGHMHTYPDAEPGQVIKQICRAGVRNPVILFDEIDKMAGGIAGSEMMATFLEILDPEQNFAFVDHYIDYPYDLSKTLFLASANKIAEGEGPLIDRMELITIPDYTREDKKTIGKKYVLPKVLKNTGLIPDNGYQVSLTDEAWLRLIDPFKWDSGMRTMQHNLYAIANKIARESLETGKKEFIITPENIRNYILV